MDQSAPAKVDKSTLFNFRSTIFPSVLPIGLHSTRFQSALMRGNHVIVAVGCCIAVWDISTDTRVKCIQTNTNVIFSIAQNETHIYCVAYNGEVAIVAQDTYHLVKRVNENCGWMTKYCSLSSTHLAVTTELSPQGGCVHVYDLEGKLVWKLNGYFRFAHLYHDTLVTLIETKIPIENKHTLNPKEYQKLKNSRKYTYEIQEFKWGSTAPFRVLDPGLGPCDVIVAASSVHLSAYLTHNRTLVVYDAQAFQLLYRGRFDGPGDIMAMSFTGDTLVISSAKHSITRINFSSTVQLPELLNLTEYPPYLSVEHIKSALSNKPQFIGEFQGRVLICDEESIVVIADSKPIYSRTFGGITFCGVDAHIPNGQLFVGNFTGDVHGYNLDASTIQNQCETNVELPIRSVVVLPGGQYVAFSNINSLYVWDRESLPNLIADTDDTITVLRATTVNGKTILAGSTIGGHLQIYEGEGDQFNLVHQFQAHKPQSDFDRVKFGSLDIRAEMWSLAFNPNDPTQIATCSEDQRVHVYKDALTSPTLVVNLEGHGLAVTSLDWQNMKMGTILASCSDDQTVRFYDSEFNLIRRITTNWIKDWHTLTYMALQKDGDLVFIGGQNGYLFIYSLSEDKFIFAEKIHLGGVEGLSWKDGTLVTCSSDNVVNVLKLQ